MKHIKNSIFFICLVVLHVELVFVFSISLYLLYFVNLFMLLYLLNRKLNDFSLLILFLHVVIVLVVINLEIYDETVFELYLYFDLLQKVPYVSSEIMYALSAVHLLLFINLKKFENFWAIIDEKLFRK